MTRTRGGQYAVVLLLALCLNFLLPRMMPGTPLGNLLGEGVAELTPADRAQVLARHHLDQPLWIQFGYYLGDLVRLDLGDSYRQRRPNLDIIAERLPWTLLLSGWALVLSTVIGALLGALAAWRRQRQDGVGLLVFFIVLNSLPAFWVGMVLISVLAVWWRWFPVFGAITAHEVMGAGERLLDIARHLALPLASLTAGKVSGQFLTLRSSMLGVLAEDYILTARAKGLSEWRVLYRHAFRNALLPLATEFALGLGFLITGSVVVEVVFAYPGLGSLLIEAVLGRDYPLMHAIFLFATISVIGLNLMVDLIYPRLDPRVRGWADGR